MIIANAAANYTRIATGQTAVPIANGETIVVHGLIVTATANGTTLILDSSGATIMTINVAGNLSQEVKTGFIASKGIKITTDANTVCTIFHSNGSA